ncbi:hypothetical protein FACS189499_04080 [Clostridia bacterium]|nr:hypothetical protein FACS189499_04080 [Clostridia bacterium]
MLKVVQKKVLKSVANMSLFAAKTAAGAVSLMGAYQPKEPADIAARLAKISRK